MIKRKTLILIISFVISIGSYAQEVMIVVTDGMGKNVESATQRAAEAALIQVVGSFIDSTEMIEKRKEIRNGVKKQTKKISSKISEYSQGMIQSIEILDVSDDDGFTRVTAKFSVRIEDFKYYIKQTIFSGKTIKKGLLAKLKNKKKQSQNLSDLIVGKILKDIISTQVIIPVIDGEIGEVTDIETIEEVNQRVSGDGHVIYIPVKATLDPSFLENAVRILDETADQKLEGSNISREALKRDRLYSITLGDFTIPNVRTLRRQKWEGGGLNWILRHWFGWRFSVKNPEDLLTYTFPERVVNELCKTTKAQMDYELYPPTFPVPDVKISFLSETGKVLRKETLRVGKNESKPPSSYFSYVSSGNAFASTSMLTTRIISKDGRKPDVCSSVSILIDTESKYKIFTKVSEDVLENTDKIVLSYSKPD
jgi:hypothetical protein